MKSIRELLEEREERELSPLACKSSQSRGRLRKVPECSVRTAFQRDRDRIIHCKSFRRLEHKTQVFLSPTGDHYRTRLTHTLEVSQIARTIARALMLNEDLVEAIAMGHDLGHTPFGHTGEEVLNNVLPGGFSHSQQSLRVVDRLERNGEGLNLTYEVRDGILKHSKDASGIFSNPQDMDPITLEGKIVRISDGIAYINHDIDDAIRGGIIKEGDLPKDCTAVLGITHSARIERMVFDVIEHSWGKPDISMGEEVLKATNDLRAFLYESVYPSRDIIGEVDKAKGLLYRLWEHFISNPQDIPGSFASRIDGEGLPQVVCDYIAGMTDRYAIRVYESLFVPKPWPIA
ncbi:MAG: deoxyguanosinetriphosphate triphosphohydrolase [bacterium]